MNEHERTQPRVNQPLKAMLHEAIFLAPCNATQQTLHCKLQKKFTCNTPFCNCNHGCVASCKKSRTTLFATLRDKLLACIIPSATCNEILSEWANQSSSFARCRRLSASAILFVFVRVASCEKSINVWHPLFNLKGFLFVIVALQVARKIASCNMALTWLFGFSRWVKKACFPFAGCLLKRWCTASLLSGQTCMLMAWCFGRFSRLVSSHTMVIPTKKWWDLFRRYCIILS